MHVSYILSMCVYVCTYMYVYKISIIPIRTLTRVMKVIKSQLKESKDPNISTVDVLSNKEETLISYITVYSFYPNLFRLVRST